MLELSEWECLCVTIGDFFEFKCCLHSNRDSGTSREEETVLELCKILCDFSDARGEIENFEGVFGEFFEASEDFAIFAVITTALD